MPDIVNLHLMMTYLCALLKALQIFMPILFLLINVIVSMAIFPIHGIYLVMDVIVNVSFNPIILNMTLNATLASLPPNAAQLPILISP